MNIAQFRYSTDNLSYLLYTKHSALVIDGGAVDQIVSYVESNDLLVEYVVNTHPHADHTIGIDLLLNRTGARYIDNSTLLQMGSVELKGVPLRVIHTPGHTPDSITFQLGNMLFTGDTLFNGNVGNCRYGSAEELYQTIKKFRSFQEDSIIYAGHDYLEMAVKIVKKLEPENSYIDQYLSNYNSKHVKSSLADEFAINPFFRLDNLQIISNLEKMGYKTESELDRFKSLLKVTP
jgi:hydroxyacylglutathione hydrolase